MKKKVMYPINPEAVHLHYVPGMDIGAYMDEEARRGGIPSDGRPVRAAIREERERLSRRYRKVAAVAFVAIVILLLAAWASMAAKAADYIAAVAYGGSERAVAASASELSNVVSAPKEQHTEDDSKPDTPAELDPGTPGIHEYHPSKLPGTFTEAEVTMLAQTVWGEARGCPRTEQAAVVWCILNWYDDPSTDWGSLEHIITYPNRFQGYDAGNPVDEDIKDLVIDVLNRYVAEKNGQSSVGRVLPKGYFWFLGDGSHNYFRNDYNDTDSIWQWTLPSPYDC